MTFEPDSKKSRLHIVLWILLGLLSLGLLLIRIYRPEPLWMTVAASSAVVLCAIFLIRENRKALTSRSAAYGFNSFVTSALVLGILAVVNFLASRHEWKFDATSNRLNTLSDQTVKVVKALNRDVKASVFSQVGNRERFRGLLDNYKALNSKFTVEYVDPIRERARVKEAGIAREDTLILSLGDKTSKIEDISEEKITNALVKISRDKRSQLCYITGHGERPLTGNAADSYDVVQRALMDQSYEVKEVNLPQELKIGENCDAILVVGATRAFFDPEVKAITEFLDHGGRALFALDFSMRGPDSSQEVAAILEEWGIGTKKLMILDPLSRLLSIDASVPVIGIFNEAQPITRDFTKDSRISCFFPFSRPLFANGKVEGLSVEWLAKSSPNSWAESDIASLTKGVKFDEGKDLKGPLEVAFTSKGKKKDSQAVRETRVVAFGSALFGTNNYSRYGNNVDLFVNSVAWLLEEENMISIRAKEDAAGRIELSQQTGELIRWIVVWIAPLLILISGIVIWVRRKKL